MGEHTEITEMNEVQSISPCRGATLIWQNLNVYTKDKKNGRGKKYLKRIINNSTGFIQPGTLMAVMGSRFDRFFVNLMMNVNIEWNLNEINRFISVAPERAR